MKEKIKELDIDEYIKNFIITLNKFDGIKTLSCCSGHTTEVNTERAKERELTRYYSIPYISFVYNESKTMQKALKFFAEEGFNVKLVNVPKNSLIPNKKHFKVTESYFLSKNRTITKENIKLFWKIMEKKFLGHMNS